MTNTHALIIDDNAQNLQVLAQLLARQGVNHTDVLDPRKLEDMLPALDAVDVVFLDLEMPGLNGYEVKDLLRSYFADVAIIAYTVHVSEIQVTRDFGFDGFLGKPLNRNRFPDQLARILRGEAVWERA